MARLLPLLFLLPAGCGSGRPTADAERARQAVVASLDSWKANEPNAKLKALPDPVEFAEELRATHTLTDYTLGQIDTSDKDAFRFPVKLTLKDKKGKLSEREAVYVVVLKSPVIVSRDPYF